MSTETQTERDTIAATIIAAEGFHDGDGPIEPESYDDCLYDVGAAEYLILTDAEADERAADYIRETLWAFNAEFLSAYMPEGIDADEIDAIRGDRCEDANDAMVALVNATGSMDDLIRDAIAADGRGHFLGGYDFEEIEHRADDGTYWYAYRVN